MEQDPRKLHIATLFSGCWVSSAAYDILPCLRYCTLCWLVFGCRILLSYPPIYTDEAVSVAIRGTGTYQAPAGRIVDPRICPQAHRQLRRAMPPSQSRK